VGTEALGRKKQEALGSGAHRERLGTGLRLRGVELNVVKHFEGCAVCIAVA
jgi:hypothetical protein